MAAIQQHGLYNLKDFLPKKPGEVELKVMSEMFAASVDGEVFDMERWGQYFRPSGYNSNTNTTAASTAPAAAPAQTEAASVSAHTPAASIAEDDVPFDEDQPSTKTVAPAPASSSDASASSRAQDILAAIRNRQKAE